MQYLGSESYIVFIRNPINHMLLESPEFQEFESPAIVSLPYKNNAESPVIHTSKNKG